MAFIFSIRSNAPLLALFLLVLPLHELMLFETFLSR